MVLSELQTVLLQYIVNNFPASRTMELTIGLGCLIILSFFGWRNLGNLIDLHLLLGCRGDVGWFVGRGSSDLGFRYWNLTTLSFVPNILVYGCLSSVILVFHILVVFFWNFVLILFFPRCTSLRICT